MRPRTRGGRTLPDSCSRMRGSRVLPPKGYSLRHESSRLARGRALSAHPVPERMGAKGGRRAGQLSTPLVQAAVVGVEWESPSGEALQSRSVSSACGPRDAVSCLFLWGGRCVHQDCAQKDVTELRKSVSVTCISQTSEKVSGVSAKFRFLTPSFQRRSVRPKSFVRDSEHFANVVTPMINLHNVINQG